MPESITWIFAAAGALLIIAALLPGLDVKEIKIPALPPKVRILSGLAGVTFILLMFFAPLEENGTARGGGPAFQISDVEVELLQDQDQLVRFSFEVIQSSGSNVPDSTFVVLQDSYGDRFIKDQLDPSHESWPISFVEGRCWRGQVALVHVAKLSAGGVADTFSSREVEIEGPTPEGC